MSHTQCNKTNLTLCAIALIPIVTTFGSLNADNLRRGGLACSSEESLRQAYAAFRTADIAALNALIRTNNCDIAQKGIAGVTRTHCELYLGQTEICKVAIKGAPMPFWTVDDFLATDADREPSRIYMVGKGRIGFADMQALQEFMISARGGLSQIEATRARLLASDRAVLLPERAYLVLLVRNGSIKIGSIFVTDGEWESLGTEKKKTGRSLFLAISDDDFEILPHTDLKLPGTDQAKTTSGETR